MRRFHVPIVLLVAALAGVASLGLPQPRPAASVARRSSIAAVDDQCTFVVAGRHATADGSVLMGYNNDWSADNFAYLKVASPPDPYRVPLPQAPYLEHHPLRAA